MVEVVRVVARIVGPGDDAAGVRVHDQHASALGVVSLDAVGERLLCRVLDVRVERKHKVLAVDRVLVGVRPEDDLSVGEVAVARDKAGRASESLLVVLLHAVFAVAVPVDETEHVRRERGAGGDAREIGALRLLLQADAGQLQGPQLIGLRFGEAPLDVGELGVRRQCRHHLGLVDAQHRRQPRRDSVAVAGGDLVRRDER